MGALTRSKGPGSNAEGCSRHPHAHPDQLILLCIQQGIDVFLSVRDILP